MSWQETHITVAESDAEAMKRYLRPETGEPPSSNTSICICETIQRVTRRKIRLEVDEESVRIVPCTESPEEAWENGDFVSLEHGLLGPNQDELLHRYRLCLASVLSYALLDFCDEPWFPGGWTRKNIFFFQRSTQLLLRPTLVTNTYSAGNYTTSDTIKLLSHGILLMEIFQQKQISFNANDILTGNLTALRSFAYEEYRKVNWDNFEWYKACVWECIDGQTSQSLVSSEKYFHRKVLRIIDMLLSDHLVIWDGVEPDVLLESVVLPSVDFETRAPEILEPIGLAEPQQQPALLVEREDCAAKFPANWSGVRLFDAAEEVSGE